MCKLHWFLPAWLGNRGRAEHGKPCQRSRPARRLVHLERLLSSAQQAKKHETGERGLVFLLFSLYIYIKEIFTM